MALNEQRERLLSRIFASRQFSYTASLKSVLKYVCEHAGDPAGPALKEYEIATQALGRPGSFDPKLDPVVRVSMTEIRERLRTFFENDRFPEALRVEIPKGQYRAIFESVVPAETEPASPLPKVNNLRRFWGKYLTSSNPNLLLHTEPLFFRENDLGLYLRNLYVNDRATGLADMRKRLPPTAKLSLEPCYHYLSSGEVYCVFALSHLFQELGASLEIRNARLCFWNEVRFSNMILLGCNRTNSFMDSLQGGSEIFISDDAIEIRNPRQGEQRRYNCRRQLDGKLRRCTEYALVSRRTGPGGNRAVTMIASNHGNAVLGAGQFLTVENSMEVLLSRMGFGGTAPIPQHFEVILQVDMIDVDDEVVGIDYVTHRILAPLPDAGRQR